MYVLKINYKHVCSALLYLKMSFLHVHCCFVTLQSVWTAFHGLPLSVWTAAHPSVTLLTSGALALRCWKSVTMGKFQLAAAHCLK